MPTNPLDRLFGRNPFRSLQEHMDVVVACAGQIVPLFEALLADDRPRVAELKESIFRKEEEADEIKNALREHLPRGMFLPVNRRDLLDVLDMQDSIADTAQDIVGLLTERHMTVPAPLREPLLPFVRRCNDAVLKASRIIGQLDDLLETGFRGRGATEVDALIRELNTLEDETDVLGIELARLLFDHEDDLKPVSVIFWYKLLELVGDLADYAEKVGNRLRLMIAR